VTLDLPNPPRKMNGARDRRRERQLREADEVLRWFFQEAESACGLRSNYESIRAQLVTGAVGSPSTNEYDVQHFEPRVMRSVHREREVQAVYARLDERDQLVLESAYQVRNFSPVVRSLLAETAGLLSLVSSEAALLALIHTKDRDGVARLKREIAKLHREALASFADLWGDR
jgi:hypothetical protein